MHTGGAGRIRLLITTVAAAAVITACQSNSSSAPQSAASSAAAAAAASAGITSSAGATSQAAAPAASAATSAAGAAVSGVNVCSLLSAAQVSAINKVTYGTGTPKQLAAGWTECDYPNKGSADPVDIQALNVGVQTFAGCWSALQRADGPGTAVSGIGDAAFGYEIGFDLHTGSTCVTIQGLTHAEFSGDHGPDEAIAKIVLAGLH
ncbi:MAG TPA: hypothetical protein VHV09_11890 [Trebonia sp.]|jgi:hypothetical protein|nr:hypothetical protein [Trebonia sp.]